MELDFLFAGLQKTSSALVEKAVRRVVRDVRTADEWRFALLPSDRHGRWDLGLSGPAGWSIAWFDSTPEDLPQRAAATVRAFLRI